MIDIGRILRAIEDADIKRADDTRELADQVGRLEDELADLADFLRRPKSPPTSSYSLTASVHSIQLSSPASLAAPSTPTATRDSFLSSHYSELDDLDSMASPLESSSMIEPVTVSLHDEKDGERTPTPSSPSSPSSLSESSLSATSSSSSVTVQPQAPISLGALRDALNRLQNQHAQLQDGQGVMANMLRNLLERPVVYPTSDHGIPDGIDNIERMLEEVLRATRKIKSVSSSSKTESEAETEAETVETIDSELEEAMLREHWKDLLKRHGLSEPTSLPAAPRPVHLPEDITFGDQGQAPGFPQAERPIRTMSPEELMTTFTPATVRPPRRPRAPSEASALVYEHPPPSVAEEEIFGDGRPAFVPARTERPIVDYGNIRYAGPPRQPQQPLEYEEAVDRLREDGQLPPMDRLVRYLRGLRNGTDGWIDPGAFGYRDGGRPQVNLYL